MKPVINEHVSHAGFARRMGCDESTVRRYLRDGKICAPAVTYKPNGKVAYLTFELAKAQYLDARAATEFRFARSGGAPTGSHNASNAMLPTISTGYQTSVSNETNDGLDGLSVPELTKREAVLRVRLKQMELDEKMGMLVKKDEVYSALFTAGQEIRNRFEAIPIRIIDNILVANSRHEALLILEKEINSVLVEVSRLGDIRLTTNATRGKRKPDSLES